MNQIHKQDCPLCSAPAEFQFVDYENRKHFRCDNCNEFVISIRAEKKLVSSIQEWRDKYSEKAKKSNDEQILVITVPSVEKQEGIGYQAIRGEFVSRN